MTLALPSKYPSKGFTLVELLVVITIIAILSVIGITIFGGVQKTARDARRRGDIDALAKAAELNYSGGVYVFPGGSAFASGSVPKDPLDGQDSCQRTDSAATKKCWYCIRGNTPLLGCNNDAAYGTNEVSNFFTGTGTGASWMICANLESGTPFCIQNAQ